MLFAVGWPIWWLWYSYADFDFDRAKALLYINWYPQAWFERQARRTANSSEATLFLISFDALRMNSSFDLCLRMAMNFSFSHRISRVVEFMIRQRQQRTNSRRINAKQSPRRQSKQLQIRKPAALIFAFVIIGVVVHTNQCVVFSDSVCEHFPECVAYAYRWSSTDLCPCRALIDVDKAPKTYSEWMEPPDGVNLMRKLALSGDLRVIEVVNRRLSILPDELQYCSELRSIMLAYTGIEVIPEWVSTFTKLELLSIEGRALDRNLVSMPEKLFAHMKVLTFLHLGIHQNLVQLPQMTGPTSLQVLSIALLLQLREISSLVALTALKRVLLVGNIHMERVPNLSPSVHLETFVVGDALACCNGYIGACDLSRNLCSTTSNCIDKSNPEKQANFVTQQLLDTVGVATCQMPEVLDEFMVVPTEEGVDRCQGIMYRQCSQANASGMCYSARMQVVACQSVQLHEIVRRQEIQQGIGLPCDPQEEKWLGCGE